MRSMTLAEQNEFAATFPNLAVKQQPRVSGEATPRYNSVAWTLGLTDRWINPPQTLANWDQLYNAFGYVRDSSEGQIAVWRAGANYTHACRVTSSQSFGWESKCGSSLRIVHNLGELVGDLYGNPVTFYKLAETAASAPRSTTSRAAASTRAVRVAPKGIDPALRQAFNAHFAAWKQTWFQGALVFSSDTRDRANTYSYNAILEMGPPAIPLVVAALADPENFIAVQLYDDLQPDSALRVTSGAPPSVSLQEHAKNTVETFLRSTK